MTNKLHGHCIQIKLHWRSGGLSASRLPYNLYVLSYASFGIYRLSTSISWVVLLVFVFIILYILITSIRHLFPQLVMSISPLVSHTWILFCISVRIALDVIFLTSETECVISFHYPILHWAGILFMITVAQRGCSLSKSIDCLRTIARLWLDSDYILELRNTHIRGTLNMHS